MVETPDTDHLVCLTYKHSFNHGPHKPCTVQAPSYHAERPLRRL